MKRVVVTGIGVITPHGCGVARTWEALLSAKSAVSKLESSLYDKIPCRVAAAVPRGQESPEVFSENRYVSKSDVRSLHPTTIFAVAAAEEAIRESGLVLGDSVREDAGVAIGMGMSDLDYIVETVLLLRDKGPSRISPYFVPRILTNMAAGHVSMKFKLGGPNHSVSTACATGAHSVGDALRFIRSGDANVMVCGGTESCIAPLSIAGFSRLRALATNFNDEPEKASRPFDKQRDGFIMGEGAGILVLEDLDHALKRNARIYGEVLGYGLSGDASHPTAPCEDGSGALRAMQNALRNAGVDPGQISYVNAHATSTPLGDLVEAKAISKLFGKQTGPIVGSMKGSIGHLQGAAGAVETCLSILSCYHGKIPPNVNLTDPDPEIADLIRLAPNHATTWTSPADERRVMLKNSFGFGGTNASLCLASFQ